MPGPPSPDSPQTPGLPGGVNNLLKIFKSVLTPIPKVLQAGQWVYSPSGIPIAILTGFLSAKKIMKKIKS